MFKKLTRESINQVGQVKSSQIRGIRTKILEQHPEIELYLEEFMPKKDTVKTAKSNAVRTQLYIVNNEVIFFEREKDLVPCLRLIHKYPFLLKKVRVDTGAIRHVLQGAIINCPGLTSAGGNLDEDFKEGEVVAILAEGKEHCLAIGVAKMCRDDVRKVNHGHAIEPIHIIGDPLWSLVLQ